MLRTFFRNQSTGLWLAFVAVLIGGYCFAVSHNRILWSDELFGWVLVTDPSFHHMMQARDGGADGGGLGFYLLCRLWLNLFGRSYLAFRMFSAAGCYLGFAFALLTLRRFYATSVSAAVLLLTWFGSVVIRWQMVQTRFYGLLLGAICLTLWAATRNAWSLGKTTRERRASLLLVFLANLFLIHVHPFGLAYSAILLLGAAVADLVFRRQRSSFYLSALLAWPTILFSRAAMNAAAQVGKPWFWTTRPTHYHLRLMWLPDAAMFGGRRFLAEHLMQAAIVLCVLAMAIWTYRSAHLRARLKAHIDLLAPAFLLLLFPAVIFVISQRGTSLFVDRYLIGWLLGLAILLAELASALLHWSTALRSNGELLKGMVYVSGGFAAAVVTYIALWYYPRHLTQPPLDFTASAGEALPKGIPVVIVRPDIADVMMAECKTPGLEPIYLLDWPLALDPRSPRGLVSGYHEMEIWQQQGFYASSIRQVDEFLHTNDEFYVMADDVIPFMDLRILGHATWSAQRITQLDFGLDTQTVWKVKRVGAIRP